MDLVLFNRLCGWMSSAWTGRLYLHNQHTPAEKDVVADVVAFGKDGDDDERVQVEPLHEDPQAAGCQHVIEGREQQLALPVLKTNNGQNR